MYLNQSVSPLYTLKTKKDAEKILGTEVEEAKKPVEVEEAEKPVEVEEAEKPVEVEEAKKN